MELRHKRASHPGYLHTGGRPKTKAVPGTKTKKEKAAEERAKKAEAKANGLRKIAALERASAETFTNYQTPRAPQSSHRGRSTGREGRRHGDHQAMSPSKSKSSDQDECSDCEDDIVELDYRHTGADSSEAPTDLEQTVKKPKRRTSVRKIVEESEDIDAIDEDEDSYLPSAAGKKRLPSQIVRFISQLRSLTLMTLVRVMSRITNRPRQTLSRRSRSPRDEQIFAKPQRSRKTSTMPWTRMKILVFQLPLEKGVCL